MGTRTGIFWASENRATDTTEECDFGLGLKMNQHKHQRDQDSSSSYSPRKKTMTAMPHNQPTSATDIYDVVAGSGSVWQRTNNFSEGGVSCRAPFSAAQWQELQRQSLIYRYMVSSVPVPPELLVPFSKTKPRSNVGRGSFELGFSGGSDPEPWRCRRTDGKKWRCSRDVAPDQKYCERHTHKGRSRSRKPVELALPSDFTEKNADKPCLKPCPVGNRTEEDRLCSFPISGYDQPRCLDWFIKGEANSISSPNQELHHMMLQSDSKDPHQRDTEDPLINLGSFTNLDKNCNLLIQSQTQETRLFIDAWSSRDEIGNQNRPLSLNGKLPFSSLSLSMSGGDDEIGGSDGERLGDLKPNWMMSPGGPLAEALCLGISSSAKVGPIAAPTSSPHSTTTSTSKSSSGDGVRVQHQDHSFFF